MISGQPEQVANRLLGFVKTPQGHDEQDQVERLAADVPRWSSRP
jgi:hypothetical protein